jgi:hypothetical protein
MKIILEQVIAKPIADVWEVLGNQFGQIDKWSSLISHSEVSGEAKIPGASFSIRSTKTTQGPTQQKLTSFNPEKHTLSYKAISGTPFFIKSVNATWSLKKKDDNTTDLTLDFEYETQGIMGLILRPIVKKKFSKLGAEIIDDFKHYVENGTPHPRKVASASK